MTFTFILLLLVPVAAVAYVMWDYKRKTAQRNAVSAERLSELMGVVKQVQGLETKVAQPIAPAQAPAVPAAAPSPATAGASPAAAPSAASAAPAAMPRPGPASTAGPAPAEAQPKPLLDESVPAAGLYARRERLLDSPRTLLYHLLRAGLPEHIVFARVTLASILEAGPGLSGVARDEQARRLGTLTVDFVLVDRTMRPLAVVELAAPDQGSVAQSDRSTARTRLAAAGVRYVELDAKALPRKENIRATVLGDAQAADAPASAGVAR